jgi:alkylhydroperoxidase/carboxymuconolactone decarboxylase family protein YurZ
MLAECNPEFLRRNGDLASHVIFGPGEGRALDLKTRLLLVGIMSFEEVAEAAFLAGLPAGMPAFEGFCRAMQEMRAGKGWVPQGD